MARKILLADDSVTAQNMGRKILADAGYEVLTVNNGSAALKKIAEAKPELIILDVYMPGYSGLEVCQRLKETHETSRIPVLLTVGKLEPFKPEEAKRVRADSYIVKPFEASELLSALSKLEDKIVPRPEAVKPGRFARANAALDEGRYDKTVAIEEDTSWKNRIAFPSKKKKAAEEDGGDDPAIYNAVNKDLRTVVERKSTAKPHDAKPEYEKVNLEALAPEGLPKDVTPEEIAALAAAAAQVKGTIADTKLAEPAPEQPVAPQTDATVVTAQPIDGKTAEAPKATEEIEPPTEKPSDAAPEVASRNATGPADVIAAVAVLEPESRKSTATDYGNGMASHEPACEPVTMAMAAGAAYTGAASRWTAVPVSLAPDEIAVSLELEMQKAYAAFAAAEVAHSGHVTITETQPVAVGPQAASEPASRPASLVEAETSHVPAIAELEVAQAANETASAATDAISAAVRELEAVAASYEAQRPISPEPEPAPAQAIEASVQTAPETAPTAEARTEENPVVTTTTSERSGKEFAPNVVYEEPKEEQQEEPKHEEPALVAEPVAATVEAASAVIAEKFEVAAPSSHLATASGEPAAGVTTVTGKKESEFAENTAAAWANWRRTRESGDATPTQTAQPNGDTEQEALPHDAAAMAVAAGAEKTPEESAAPPDADSGEIASIVDSVLADLRPKIMAEVSRKLGKKK